MTQDNPFAALTLIAAPAIVTNACSILILSTSNRLARAADRARQLTDMLEKDESGSPEACIRELRSAAARSVMLAKALRLFYGALGGFAGSAFVSLLGAVIASRVPAVPVWPFELAAVAMGLLAVGSLVIGAGLLVREAKIAIDMLKERAAYAEERARAIHRSTGVQ